MILLKIKLILKKGNLFSKKPFVFLKKEIYFLFYDFFSKIHFFRKEIYFLFCIFFRIAKMRKIFLIHDSLFKNILDKKLTLKKLLFFNEK